MSVSCGDSCDVYISSFNGMLSVLNVQTPYSLAVSRSLPVLCTLANCGTICSQPSCTTIDYDFVSTVYVPDGYTLHSNYAGDPLFQCWGRFFWAYRGEETPRLTMGWLTEAFGSSSLIITEGPAYGASDGVTVKPALPDDVAAAIRNRLAMTLLNSQALGTVRTSEIKQIGDDYGLETFMVQDSDTINLYVGALRADPTKYSDVFYFYLTPTASPYGSSGTAVEIAPLRGNPSVPNYTPIGISLRFGGGSIKWGNSGWQTCNGAIRPGIFL